MKLVIDIPEGLKKDFELEQWTALSCMEMKDALMNGTPLPRGHGDLIDRNDLLEYTDSNICAYTPTINRYDIITTPTIIEANKEG